MLFGSDYSLPVKPFQRKSVLTPYITTVSQPVTILIVDDHPMMRNALKALLPHDNTIEVVATAASGPEAEQLYEQFLPDVVVMDIYMKPVSGIETASNILLRYPDAKILGFSNAWSEEDAHALQEIGGRGYLVKTAPLHVIVDRIRKVAEGNFCFESTDHPA